MSYGPSTFDTPEIALEDIICEIIDNSIAANADHIHIQIGNDSNLEDGEPSLNFDVFDNGTKVREKPWTEADIQKAFEIEFDPNNPPERAEGETGKFHVGMKIATLSKFDTVSMITTLEDDDFLEYHGTYPSLERTKEDINNRYGLENNPSSTPPSTVNTVEMVSIMKENNMSTWVGGRSPRVALLFGGKENDREYKANYLKHLRTYLGIIYQLYLEDNDFKLTLGNWNSKIAPVDPFWEGFTTENLRLHASSLSDETERKVVNNLARFGTLAQKENSFTIEGFDMSVQGFIVPQGDGKKNTAKKAMKSQFPRLRVKSGDSAAFMGGETDAGSPSLKSSNTGGFYIYRGKRCINFGGNPKNNHGFYTLKNPITSSWATRLRIRVKYDENLDHKMILHPNKHSFRHISKDIWVEIKNELSKTIGGETFRASPYDVSRPFCTWSGTSQFSKMLAKEGKKTIWSHADCERCDLLIHEQSEYCDLDACEVCGELANINQCTRKVCRTECIHCAAVGEHPSNQCPEIEWEDEEEDEEIPDEDEEIPEEEDDSEDGDETSQAEYDIIDNEILATLPIDSKESCTEVLRQILEILEIDVAKLE
ncbi:MAG: hypothetical protein CMA94_07665 [Euryarchaeota archaeon]|nr:hypothetical protein [Euryarchaeota archaeon]